MDIRFQETQEMIDAPCTDDLHRVRRRVVGYHTNNVRALVLLDIRCSYVCTDHLRMYFALAGMALGE